MFYNSTEFKILEAGTKLNTIQQQTHLQNISNIETPNYKSKSLVFKEMLDSEKVRKKSSITAEIVEDESLITRPDGNNVNLETENLKLYKTYAQYSMLLDKIKGQFTRYNAVLNNNMK